MTKNEAATLVFVPFKGMGLVERIHINKDNNEAIWRAIPHREWHLYLGRTLGVSFFCSDFTFERKWGNNNDWVYYAVRKDGEKFILDDGDCFQIISCRNGETVSFL